MQQDGFLSTKIILPPLRSGQRSELAPPASPAKIKPMPRKKATDKDALLTCSVRTRVTQTAWNRLEKIKTESGCQTVGEVARMVLSDEPIKCFYVNISLNGPMEQ